MLACPGVFRIHSTVRRDRGVTRRTMAVAATAIVTAIVQSARAAPFIQLEWRSPDECLLAANVEHSVQRMVKREPLVVQTARVVIERHESRWTATLDMQHGVRRLEGASCEELAETLAVVIALAIDPLAQAPETPDPLTTRGSAESTEAAAPIVEPASAANQAEASDAPRETAQEREPAVVTVPPTKIERINPPGRLASPSSAPGLRRSSLILSGGVGAMGEWGSLPSVAAAGSLGLRVAGRNWAARARWASFFSQDASVDERPVGTIGFRFGALEPCVANAWLATRWEFCAAFEYGSLSGRGHGLLSSGTGGTTYWYALGAAVGSWFEILRYLQLEPRLGIALPLFRPSFTTGEVTSVHRIGPVSGRAELNLWLVY